MPDPKKLRGTNRQAGQKYRGIAGILVILTLLGLFMAFPIYLTVITAFKPVEELFVYPPKLYPTAPTLDNFRDMFRVLGEMWVPFSRYVFNSAAITVIVVVGQCFVASMAAFVLAKCEFPGRRFLNGLIVVSLLYNSNVIYLMQYIVMAKLGIINSTLSLILPSIASSMGLFLMRQSISQVPDAMIEAAKVDGANLFTICWQIVIPNQKPALMTMSIFAFQAAWNMQGGNFLYDEEKKTLPTVIQQAASAGLGRAGVAMAASVLMLIPPVLFFMLAQKNVMETMAHSGIKD